MQGHLVLYCKISGVVSLSKSCAVRISSKFQYEAECPQESESSLLSRRLVAEEKPKLGHSQMDSWLCESNNFTSH